MKKRKKLHTSVRLPPDVKKALKGMASDHGWSTAGALVFVLENYLKMVGRLAPSKLELTTPYRRDYLE